MQRLSAIEYSNCSEVGVNQFGIDASDFGIGPGAAAPHRIKTSMGNGKDFQFTGVDNFGSIRYQQLNGCIYLTIFND
jgi:hypothetical protein